MKFFIAIKKFILAHKVICAIVVIVVAGGGYVAVKKNTAQNQPNQYLMTKVAKGTIVVAVAGSGQVSTTNQVDIKPKVSGDIVYLNLKNGQDVKAGTVLARIDARTVLKAVRDAKVSLESAQISLQKLTQPVDNLSVVQSRNALARSQDAKKTAGDDLTKTYDEAYNSIANVFLDLPTMVNGLQNTMYSYVGSLGGNAQWNIDYYTDAIAVYDKDKSVKFRVDADLKYKIARNSYDKNFLNFKSADRDSNDATIDALLNETYTTLINVAAAIKSSNNLIQLYQDQLTERYLRVPITADTNLATLNGYIGTVNSALSSLLSIKNTIKIDRETIVSSDRSIVENTESLSKLLKGTDVLDINSAKLTIAQRQNTLLDAQAQLADYSILAPFNGTITKLVVKKADAVSTGSVIATLITKQKLAQVSLNEVDVAKIKIGQKATITFDAINDLSLTGVVAEIDALGTVTQGVVNYTVKITFDTQDERVKPGMSASAAIITEVKQNILVLPNGAIKSQNNASYVDRFVVLKADESLTVVTLLVPDRTMVQPGISNDSLVEVRSGLKEGDEVVMRTISTTTAAKAAASSLFALPGSSGRGAAGGGGGRAIQR